jgi:hypothetical protein
MAHRDNTNSTWLRRAIGGIVLAFVWGSFLVRVFWGAGPMHDPQGNQAPVAHYLAGAIFCTILVAAWILSREWLDRRNQN